MNLHISNLTKQFDHRPALHGISLDVHQGELLGIVGPDGAGKSTLLRLLAGALAPSSGRIENPYKRDRVGYLSQHFSLYPDLTVWENVAFFAGIYGLTSRAVQERGQYLLEWVGLWKVRDRLAAHLSGGMKQKLSLACAMVHPTDLMLLDEPTTAVDPISRQEFWELIQDLVRQGTTIVISTPYMEEAARCHRVAFLHEGRLLACNTPAELRHTMDRPTLRIQAPGMNRSKLEEAAMLLPGALSVHTFGDSLHVSLRASIALQEAKQMLDTSLAVSPDVEAIEPSLEDIYIWMLTREVSQ